MSDINKVILVGRLTKDMELSKTERGNNGFGSTGGVECL